MTKVYCRRVEIHQTRCLIQKLLSLLYSAVQFKIHMQELALGSTFVDHQILSSVCESLFERTHMKVKSNRVIFGDMTGQITY